MKNVTTFNLDELEGFDKIFCLVSGGIDSTYLYELLVGRFNSKTYPVNCFSPYENSNTLTMMKTFKNFIQINPEEKYDYPSILKEAFLKLNDAAELRYKGKYNKKIFSCCYYMKHKAFMKDPLFKEDNTVVISGIKRGDGKQRRIWLTQLSDGREPRNQSDGKPTFFHEHLSGQLYCYPFRDYAKRELHEDVINKLRVKYPTLDHSGCSACPVVILFNVRDTPTHVSSLTYLKSLIKNEEFMPSRLLEIYMNGHVKRKYIKKLLEKESIKT